MKKRKNSVKSQVTSEIKASARAREFRDGITRVGITTLPIKGRDTQAEQANRWTP